jgi:hypothetical protein
LLVTASCWPACGTTSRARTKYRENDAAADRGQNVPKSMSSVLIM